MPTTANNNINKDPDKIAALNGQSSQHSTGEKSNQESTNHDLHTDSKTELTPLTKEMKLKEPDLVLNNNDNDTKKAVKLPFDTDKTDKSEADLKLGKVAIEKEVKPVETRVVKEKEEKPETRVVKEKEEKLAETMDVKEREVKPETKDIKLKSNDTKSKLPELTKSQLLEFKNKDKIPPPILVSPANQQSQPIGLNKATLSGLNKSLKAKQKIINLSQPHPKNSTLISEIINSSPNVSKFPNNITDQENSAHQLNMSASNASLNSVSNNGLINTTNIADVSNPDSGTTTPKVVNNLVNNKLDISDDNADLPKDPLKKVKQKKITKQNSTRTDFFAAKLASAVDDIDSSDSDETFIYDNNDNNTNPNPNTATSTLNLDNNSIHGSIKPQSIHSHSFHENANPYENQANDSSLQSSLAQKVQSFKSSNNINPPIPQNNRPPSIANSVSSNQFFESNQNLTNSGNYNRDKRLGSRKSISTFKSSDDPVNTIKLYTEKSSSPTGAFTEIGQNYTREPSLNENYSYDDEIEDYVDDDVSTDGEFFKNQQVLNSNSHNIFNSANNNVAPSTSDNDKVLSEKGKKNLKASSTSSRLRSTTSKLFDKKGSQPRRYSIIPDDIDIEDFDDDLIYYDNTIRFPYGPGGGGAPNENSPLISANHKLPHYKSLNFPGGRRVLTGKRYMSDQASNMIHSNVNSDANSFQFNYDQQNRQHPLTQSQYYYDAEEFDEESQANNEHNLKRYKSNGKGRYVHPHLSPGNHHYYLPRSTSKNFTSTRGSYVKSFIYTLIAVFGILGVGFVMGFILATTKELEEVSILSIVNPIVSEDELVFNIIIDAVNPGWSAVEIETVELDIFAKSGYLPDDGDDDDDDGGENVENNGDGPRYRTRSVETVLIGTVSELEVPISFSGGFFNKIHEKQTGEIKLISPGKNLTNILSSIDLIHRSNITIPDNSRKWEIISKNPFDLIVRGVLKYNLPLGSKEKLVQVNKVGYIDPSGPNR